ncbi:MAG: NAD(+) synthase [Parcubacteria group bacterium]|jgi:NAD+ synthase
MGEGVGRSGRSSASSSGSEGGIRATSTGARGLIGTRGAYTGGASACDREGCAEGRSFSDYEKIDPPVFRDDQPSDMPVKESRGYKFCAVATVIYEGNEDHPMVERLRQFRDNRLMMYPRGRKFIDFYYNGFGFRLALIMWRYFPQVLPIVRKLFDRIIPSLPTSLITENKEIPADVFTMDFVKFCLVCTDFLHKKAKAREAKCLCVGLSGGIDSALVAKMCKLTGMEVVAITISGEGFIREQDVCDAQTVATHLGIRHIVLDMTDLFEKAVMYNLPNHAHIIMGLRNTVIKEVAESLGGFLIGTSVKTELYSGLFSPNSMAGATQPLESLFKTQVYALADYLNLPDCVLKKPSHSGINGDGDDSFFGLGCALFDWVAYLIERELSTKEIASETGVEKCVIDAIKRQKKLSDELLSFPELHFK